MHHIKYSLAVIDARTKRVLHKGHHKSPKKFAVNFTKASCKLSKAFRGGLTKNTNNALCIRQPHVMNINTGLVKVYKVTYRKIKPKMMMMGGNPVVISHSTKSKLVRSYYL